MSVDKDTVAKIASLARLPHELRVQTNNDLVSLQLVTHRVVDLEKAIDFPVPGGLQELRNRLKQALAGSADKELLQRVAREFTEIEDNAPGTTSGDPAIQARLGLLYYKLGDLKKAAAFMSQAAKLAPHSKTIQNNLKKIQARLS